MFTLDAMDGREKYDTIVSTIKQRKRQIEIEVDEWLTHIDSEDISRIAQRLEFSTEWCVRSLWAGIHQVLKGLEENDEKPKYTWDLRVPHRNSRCAARGVEAGRRIRGSRPARMGNLIHQFTLSAWLMW